MLFFTSPAYRAATAGFSRRRVAKPRWAKPAQPALQEFWSRFAVPEHHQRGPSAFALVVEERQHRMAKFVWRFWYGLVGGFLGWISGTARAVRLRRRETAPPNHGAFERFLGEMMTKNQQTRGHTAPNAPVDDDR
jgi:hypothetical protein